MIQKVCTRQNGVSERYLSPNFIGFDSVVAESRGINFGSIPPSAGSKMGGIPLRKMKQPKDVRP